MIPYILTDNSLTVVLNGQSLTMEKTDPAFKEAKVALAKEEWERLENLFDTSKAVEDFAEGNMRVTDGEVFYKDQALHNHVVGRVLDFMSHGRSDRKFKVFREKNQLNPEEFDIFPQDA